MYLCPARGASHTWAKKLLGIVFWTCQLVLLFVFDIKALLGVQFWVRISDPRTNWALFHQIRIAKLEAYNDKQKRIWKDILGKRTEYLTNIHPAAEMFEVVGSPLCSSVFCWEDQLVASIAPAHIEVASFINLHLHTHCTVHKHKLGGKSMHRQKVSGNQIRWHSHPRFWVNEGLTRGIQPL